MFIRLYAGGSLLLKTFEQETLWRLILNVFNFFFFFPDENVKK